MKIKLKVTIERTFEPMVEFYENSHPMAILEQEIRLNKSEPDYLLQHNDSIVTVEGELIES